MLITSFLYHSSTVFKIFKKKAGSWSGSRFFSIVGSWLGRLISISHDQAAGCFQNYLKKKILTSCQGYWYTWYILALVNSSLYKYDIHFSCHEPFIMFFKIFQKKFSSFKPTIVCRLGVCHFKTEHFRSRVYGTWVITRLLHAVKIARPIEFWEPIIFENRPAAARGSFLTWTPSHYQEMKKDHNITCSGELSCLVWKHFNQDCNILLV